MDNRILGRPPRPCDLVKALKSRFENQSIIDDDDVMWELRFLFQLVERDSRQFKINIAVVANRDGSAQELQHVVYLALSSNNDQLALCWPNDINRPLELALSVFDTIYPIDELIREIRAVLVPLPMKLMIPGLDVTLLKTHAI